MLISSSQFTQSPQLSTNSVTANARIGMQSGQAQVTAASVEISRLNTSPSNVSVSQELVNLLEGEFVFKANARSMESASRMFEALLMRSNETTNEVSQ